MAKKKLTEQKEYTPGNVIYTRQNVFYDEIFTIHADLVRKGAELDERNIGYYVDFLNSFVAGYNEYIPDKADIKKKIEKIKEKLSAEDYLKLTFRIFEHGLVNIGQTDFIKYKKEISDLKKDIFDVFEMICENLPRKNIFPKEIENSSSDDNYFS